MIAPIRDLPILTIMVFLPLAGSFFILLGHGRRWTQGISLVTTLLTFVLTLVPLFLFRSDLAGFQMVEILPWIGALGISYHVGIDGLSLFLLPLTGLLSVMAILVSWNWVRMKEQAYFISFLVLETGMLGVFVSLDAFLFFVFWEAMLIPMFFIIGIWGSENRRYAAIKFIIYTMAGSVFLLVALIIMSLLNRQLGGILSFNLLDWMSLKIPAYLQHGLFLLFTMAFAIKVPIFPFHTWLPDAHVEAPTAGSVILAGVLLKMGVYGILRFCFPLFPEAVVFFTPLMIVLGLIGVIYGAFVAFAQKDLKKLVAYSSVSHMGLIIVGIFSLTMAGLQGGIIQMINHGLSTGALFILVGALYERKKTRNMDNLGGLAGRVPVLASFFVIIMLSSIGLPGLNGFVGEFLLLLGAFQFRWWLGALAGTTMILGAIYLLWMTQRVLFEKDRSPEKGHFTDFSPRELFIMTPIVLFIFFIGLAPSYIMDRLTVVSKGILSSPVLSQPLSGSKLGKNDPVNIKEVNHEFHSTRR